MTNGTGRSKVASEVGIGGLRHCEAAIQGTHQGDQGSVHRSSKVSGQTLVCRAVWFFIKQLSRRGAEKLAKKNRADARFFI
jgi:hypothetical protein